MLNIILIGCCGRMGTAVTAAAKNADNIKIVAGVDVYDSGDRAYPVYGNVADVNENADVIIDFSNPSSLGSVLAYSLKNNVPAVLCATGYSEEDIAAIRGASEKVAMFRSGNMSLGINVLSKLAKAAAEILGGSFDVEIVEMHHNKKKDAPSGTAVTLAETVGKVLGLDYEKDTRHGRVGMVGARTKKEIGMHSLRGGDVVGDHTVIFAADGERIELTHRASSRDTFVHGALRAAEFLQTAPNGLYDMRDVLGFK